MIRILFFAWVCGSILTRMAFAQSSDDKYALPLEDVIGILEERYGIHIKYDAHLVAGKTLNYAAWRFRDDVDKTLQNVLAPLDLKVNKEGEGKYKLKEYEYYRWEPQDGWNYLDQLAEQYHDKDSWEQRKQQIRSDLYKALKLEPIPAAPPSTPLVTKKRKMGTYTVENFALEIMPGLYVNGSIYKPAKSKGKLPLMLSPDGHWAGHRFRKDAQIRCAMTAQLGAVAVSYDLFGWGESTLQFKSEDHRRSLSLAVQTLGAIRILDWMLADKNIDTERVGICGGSGGGSQSVLLTALDDRIKLSVPVVSLSSYHFGGCPCESGMPIHAAAGGTNNVELAAMAAPRPQLLISDGKDWTAHMPEHDFPYLQTIYGYYGKADLVKNIHLPEDAHDFGYSKRKPVYDFISKHFNLDTKGLKDAAGDYDESGCIIEEETALYAFGPHGENLPSNAIKGYENLEKLFKKEAYESIK